MKFKHLKGILATTLLAGVMGGSAVEMQTQAPLANAQAHVKATKSAKSAKTGQTTNVKVNSAPKTVKHTAVHQHPAKLDKGYHGYKKHAHQHSKPVAKDKHGKKVKNGGGMTKQQTKRMHDFYQSSNQTKGSKKLTHKQARASVIPAKNVTINK